MRNILARMLREARGSPANVARGALGISSETCADNASARLTATSIPPALILRAVANSRNSLPLSSRLRTKTGSAQSDRPHLRLPVSGLLWFTQTPSVPFLTPVSSISGAKSGNKSGVTGMTPGETGQVTPSNPQCAGLPVSDPPDSVRHAYPLADG